MSELRIGKEPQQPEMSENMEEVINKEAQSEYQYNECKTFDHTKTSIVKHIEPQRAITERYQTELSQPSFDKENIKVKIQNVQLAKQKPSTRPINIQPKISCFRASSRKGLKEEQGQEEIINQSSQTSMLKPKIPCSRIKPIVK